jgi:hypothetical protein
MGLAIIVPSISFADANLGKVTLSGNEPIRGLYINLEDSYAGTTVDLKCSYLPANTTQRNVVWSIESGSEYASISGSTLTILSGASHNDVTVKCTSASNPSISATKTISVTYESGGIVWHDFTEDMIVENRTISNIDGQITDGGQVIRKVLLLPIPQNVSTLRLKIIGNFTNENDTVSFINTDNLNTVPVNATHFINWNSTVNTEISIPIQSGDVSVVCWQKINDTVYGIGNKVYRFE